MRSHGALTALFLLLFSPVATLGAEHSSAGLATADVETAGRERAAFGLPQTGPRLRRSSARAWTSEPSGGVSR